MEKISRQVRCTAGAPLTTGTKSATSTPPTVDVAPKISTQFAVGSPPAASAIDTPGSCVSSSAKGVVHMLGEAFLETLWPTRCAVCDEPGELLCATCRLNLPYIDWWRACPRCGAPYGRVLCSECNPIMLAALDRQELPFTAAASAVSYETAARRIVSAYKDRGERRLAGTMAHIMVPYIVPEWKASISAVTFVPATVAACRRRGFDHADFLAQAVAERIGLPCLTMLRRPRNIDQRKLSRHGRLVNMQGRFASLPGATLPSDVLLVDDVSTTGATLFAATAALCKAGVDHVYCLTFARAW